MTEEELRTLFPAATIARGISVITLTDGEVQLSVSFDRQADGADRAAIAKLAAHAQALGLAPATPGAVESDAE